MNAKNGFIVAALSASLIALELTWTRIFSAEFFYTFAFLILSLAILGLGLGALVLHLTPVLNNRRHLGTLLSLTGICMLIGPPLVFKLGLDFTGIFHDVKMAGIFVLATFILNSAFFFGGMALTMIFKQNHTQIPKLYMADLLGAALGLLLIFPVMQFAGTPATTFLCAIPVLLAAFLAHRHIWKTVPIFLLILLALLIVDPGDRLSARGQDPAALLEAERQDRAPVIYKHWDAMGKIKIFDFGEGYRGIEIDNLANSPIYEFDGNWDRPDSLRFQFRLEIQYLADLFDDCAFLALGAGGGTDILQALQAGVSEAHAVEVIPHINEMMTGNGYLAAYTGNIYADPRVIVATEDARAYARRHRNKFDIIFSKSSNTFSAMASGAFAMAENYLFTTEAYQDYWLALTDQGFLAMEHQFYMPRIVTEVIDALTELGIENPRDHFAIYNLKQARRKVLLMSKRPLTEEICANAFGELTPEIDEYIHLLYPPGEGHEDNHYQKIIDNGWHSVQDSLPIDLSPCTDNRPYIAQLGLMKNFGLDKLSKMSHYMEIFGFPLSKLMVVIILGIMLILILPLNLLPCLRRDKPKLRPVPWLYFFTIGMAFMAIEVILIQKYARFIGPSVYSMATVLMTLLLTSGIGSRFARNFNKHLVFLGIIAWLLLDILCLSKLTYALGGLSQVPRLIVAGLLISPLGFLMGMPFPKAGLRVGSLIDWGFAVNGAASVLGSTLIILVAFVYGFNVSLLIGALLYGIAYLLFSEKKAWVSATEESLSTQENH